MATDVGQGPWPSAAAWDARLVEGLAVVDADDRADHLGDDERVPEVCPHRLRLLACVCEDQYDAIVWARREFRAEAIS